jgi:hypothetical protein
MKVIKPITVTDAILASSTIPEPDTGETAWTAGTYTLGTRRILTSTHKIYEVVADPSTSDNPLDGIAATPATWIEVQPTNRWAMFDNVNSTVSTSDNLTVSLTPGKVAAGLAAFGVSAESVNITCVSASAGEVYNRNIGMLNNDAVSDWYTYFFEPIISIDQFILTDIPAYSDLTTTITLSGTNNKIGTLVVGNVIDLGVALYGTNWQGLDFSKKERDQFGNVVLSQGRTADRLDYNIHTDKGRFGYVKQQLRLLTGVPSVWIGNPYDVNDGTAVFGYYVDNQINISNPSKLDVSITVESFI